jgi:hypothetical protein
VFDELGLTIQPRLSEAAIIDAARLVAADLLAGSGSPRDTTAILAGTYIAAGYPQELADFNGLADWYGLVDQGIVRGPTEQVDAAVMESAQALAHGESRPRFSVAERFLEG